MRSLPYRQPESLVDTVESVANKIVTVNANEGEVSVRGVPVRFNLRNGNASIVSQNVGNSIKNEFHFNDQGILPLVQSAISLIAKHQLLSQLLTLDDKQITAHIKSLQYLTEAEVDKTLAKIQRSGGVTLFSKPTPTQQAVTKAIGGKPINSLDVTDDVMSELRNKMAQKPKSTL